MSSTILFVGGGSIGHIAPNVAIWQEYQKIHPTAQCLFVCANRNDDKTFLQNYNLPYKTISSPRLKLNFPYTFLRSLIEAIKILWQLTPDAIMSKGGYISVPICIIGSIMEIPIVLHESDAVSGRANKFVSKWAKKICYGFPRSTLDAKSVITGNPVRSSLTEGSTQKGYQLTGFSGQKPIMLVTGGSQGSQAINEAVWQNLPTLLTLCDIIHITGTGKNAAKQLVHIPTKDQYFVREFVTAELSDLYAISNFTLTRASASTITELTVKKIPMILCPLRGVGHDHQKVNANTVEQTGSAIQIEQTALPSKLVAIITDLVSNPQKLADMKSAMHSKQHLQAANKIATILSEEKLDANSK